MSMKRILVLLLALAAACKSKDDTKILVEVWSDLATPSQMNAVRIDISGPTAINSETFPLATQKQLPVRLTLVPRGEKDAILTVRAVALLGTAEKAWQAAQVAFVPGEAKLLKLNIESLCTTAGCSASQSCVAGACVPVPTIPNLPDYDPKAPATPPDAGTQPTVDGGFDGGNGETGEVGAGKDASPDRGSDGAPSDSPMGAGGTGGAAASSTNTGGAGGDTATTSNTGATAGGLAGSSGSAGATASSTGGSGGKSSTGGAIALGGSSSTGIVVLPPDAAVPDDAPIGGSAGGAVSSTAGTSGAGGASATAGVSAMAGTNAGSSSTTGGAIAIGGTNATGGTSATGGASTVVDCGSLGKPTNGSVSAPITTLGSSARYSCDTGYKLTGTETRDCLANGTWSGSAPTCPLVDCGPLAKPDNGAVDAPVTTYNSTATYSCPTTGYVLSGGNETRNCQASGTWSGTAPTCVLLSSIGGVCSITADCPSDFTCCNGSNQSCDATRLPAGDGTNPGQFVVSNDGLTVTDTITGLVWQRDSSGARAGCTNSPGCTLAEAKAYCAGLTLGGLTGWRLPGRFELLTIVDFTKLAPAIDQTAFPSTTLDWFWTSSPYAGSSDGSAWFVRFSIGDSGGLTVGANSGVRCVR
jgi:hypothetical protein